MDVLSDVLRVFRLKGAFFLNAELGEPWCVSAPGGTELARMLSRTDGPMAVCHLIVEGRCWIRFADEEAIALEPGDVVALPHGHAHLLGSGPGGTPVRLRDAIELQPGGLSRTRYGGHGATTLIVCGWFAYDRQLISPVLAALPRLLHARLRRRASGAWLESSIRYAVEEATSQRPGADAIAEKLAELLFIETLRDHIDALPERQSGWLAALRDPLVGRSIALLHQRPAHAWTVASLAQAAHASRTVLAERFAALVGMPPMQYLTQWRMALAGHLLCNDRLGLIRIAEQVGYESEAAFSRAFKRAYGTPPGAWRRTAAAVRREDLGNDRRENLVPAAGGV